MSILLEAEHLTKIFTQRGKNPFKAVNDVSFTLKKGETLGIVGESGSGKSTIAKLLTRLTDITEGTLKFEGKDITRLKQSQLKEVYGDIQMVFQNPVGSFDPRRTLGDGIGESLRNRGMKKADVEKRVAELLEQCGLEKEYAKRYPHEVSGGQCQRAAIARALAVEPKVLICDEATSALDVTIQKQIMELLDLLRKMYPKDFHFLPPVREDGKPFLSLLAGHRDFEHPDWDAESLLARYRKESEDFRQRKAPYERYPRG